MRFLRATSFLRSSTAAWIRDGSIQTPKNRESILVQESILMTNKEQTWDL